MFFIFFFYVVSILISFEQLLWTASDRTRGWITWLSWGMGMSFISRLAGLDRNLSLLAHYMVIYKNTFYLVFKSCKIQFSSKFLLQSTASSTPQFPEKSAIGPGGVLLFTISIANKTIANNNYLGFYERFIRVRKYHAALGWWLKEPFCVSRILAIFEKWW